MRFDVNDNQKGKVDGTLSGGSVTVYSNGQTVSSPEHITLGADEVIYEFVGRESDMVLDGARASEGEVGQKENVVALP